MTGFVYPNLVRSLSPDDFDASRGQVGLRTLSDCIDPYIEIIFVHSLLGDSNLSWTFENDKARFWPEWLTEDIEFCKTRIHTYGYHEPPVNNRAPVSRLRDIGIALCAAIEVNNLIRSDSHVRKLSRAPEAGCTGS